jgi:hypothetical protein
MEMTHTIKAVESNITCDRPYSASLIKECLNT